MWDTAFTVQAILATPFAHEYTKSLKRAHVFIRQNQITENVPQDASRIRSACDFLIRHQKADGGWGKAI